MWWWPARKACQGRRKIEGHALVFRPSFRFLPLRYFCFTIVEIGLPYSNVEEMIIRSSDLWTMLTCGTFEFWPITHDAQRLFRLEKFAQFSCCTRSYLRLWQPFCRHFDAVVPMMRNSIPLGYSTKLNKGSKQSRWIHCVSRIIYIGFACIFDDWISHHVHYVFVMSIRV